MSVALVASTSFTTASGPGGTTPAINTTGATLLVIFASWGNGAITISDSKGNTYRPIPGAQNGAAGQGRFYYCASDTPVVGTSHTFTVAGTSQFPVLSCMAFSGVTASNALNMMMGSTTTGTPGSVTPTVGGSLVITGFHLEGTSTAITTPTGFTAVTTVQATASVNYGGATGYQVQSGVPAAANPTWATTGGTTLSSVIVAFKPAGNITDQQYSDWLRRNNPRAVLADLDYVYAGSVVPPTNVAASSAAATATASTTNGTHTAAKANDSVRYANGDSWVNAVAGTFPEWLQVDFAASKTINKAVIYFVGDDLTQATDPYDGQVGSSRAVLDFTLQAWTGTAWQVIASVTGNTLVKRTLLFDTYTTSKIRLVVTATPSSGFIRIAEVEVYDADPAIGTAYVATQPFQTGVGDFPSGKKYRDTILEVPNYSRSIDFETLGGRMRNNVGKLVFDNADGRMNWILDAIIDGREVRFKLGDPSWNVADFRPVFSAIMSRAEVTKRGEITVHLQPGELLLNVGIVGANVGGLTSNAALPAPITIGYAAQVQALLKTSASLTYTWCDPAYYYGPSGAGSPVSTLPILNAYSNGIDLGPTILTGTLSPTADAATDQVNMNGTVTNGLPNVGDVLMLFNTGGGTAPAPLTFGTQYWVVATGGASPAQWIKLGLTRGGAAINLTTNGTLNVGFTILYKQSFYDNANGTLDLSADPAGAVVTVRAINRAFNNGLATGADMFWWVYYSAARLLPDYWSGAHASWQDLNKFSICLQERTNLTELLDSIAATGVAFWGTTRLGKFTYGQIRLYDGDPATGWSTAQTTFTDDDVIVDDAKVERMAPKYQKMITWFNINYPPLTQVAAAATADNTAKFMARGQVRDIYDTTVNNPPNTYAIRPSRYHASMYDSQEVSTLAYDTLGNTYAQNYYRQVLPHIEKLAWTAPLRAYSLELGDLVSVYMPVNCGHASSTSWQVLGVDIRLWPRDAPPSTGLELVRRRAPDSTTSTHI